MWLKIVIAENGNLAIPNTRQAGHTVIVNSQTSFPPVSLFESDSEISPQYSGLSEVTPKFDREPYLDWCRLFRLACVEDPDLDWKEAGFASCQTDRVPEVLKRLAAITAATNLKFAEFLDKVSQNDPEKVADLLQLEGIGSASANGGAYLCNWVD